MSGTRRLRDRHPDYGGCEDPHAKGRKSPVYGRTLDALARLRPGEGLVYHTDGAARLPGAFAAVADVTEQGTVIPVQRREDGRLVWVARRR